VPRIRADHTDRVSDLSPCQRQRSPHSPGRLRLAGGDPMS